MFVHDVLRVFVQVFILAYFIIYLFTFRNGYDRSYYQNESEKYTLPNVKALVQFWDTFLEKKLSQR